MAIWTHRGYSANYAQPRNNYSLDLQRYNTGSKKQEPKNLGHANRIQTADVSFLMGKKSSDEQVCSSVTLNSACTCFSSRITVKIAVKCTLGWFSPTLLSALN